jgi:WW domain-containing oxidoreductase
MSVTGNVASHCVTCVTFEMQPEASVEFMQLNLASLKSVKAFAEEVMAKELSLNILVCNAGVFGGPYRYVHMYMHDVIPAYNNMILC